MNSRGVAVGMVLLGSLTFLLSCSEWIETEAIEIDQHRFVVPKDHILPSEVFWFRSLPKTTGLHFLLDPDAPAGAGRAALLESRAATCPPGLDPRSVRAGACGASLDWPPEYGRMEREFVYRGNDAFWIYTIGADSGRRYVLASCYAHFADTGGTCQSYGRYFNLVYSFSVNDSEIDRLAEYRSRIEALLTSWEQK
jgi:hypothetical protein